MVKKASLWDFFKEIWGERPHISYLSGRKIPYFDPKSFAHVLSRNRYPLFKFEKENVVLLLAEEHTLLDQGTELQRENYAKKWGCSWEKIVSLQEELKEKYNERNN